MFLHDPALLPFAALTQTQEPEQLLDRIVQQVAAMPETIQRREVSGYVQLMAGLKYDRSIIRRIFQEGMMRQSVIYQEIFEEGEQVGEARGRRMQGRSLILLQIEQRIGEVSLGQRDRISELNLEQMEALAIALLNFSTAADLENWLAESGLK